MKENKGKTLAALFMAGDFSLCVRERRGREREKRGWMRYIRGLHIYRDEVANLLGILSLKKIVTFFLIDAN